MKSALFLGCSVPVRAMNYEVSVRKVSERFGVEFADIDDFGCCGYPLAAVSELTACTMAARNLAIAAAHNHSIVALCSACSGFLSETAHRLGHDEELCAKVNEMLVPLNLKYDGSRPVKVRHFVRLLLDDVSEERIRKEIRVPLGGIRVAAHYGCHYLRPRSLHEGEEDPENPGSLDRLVELTGAESVYYENRLGCCGGGILGVKEDTALMVAKKKLDSIAEAKVDTMVTICPFCSVMFEGNQKKIEKSFEAAYNLPVLYYPQLLGLAMGIYPDELGLKMNRIKTGDLVDKISGSSPAA